MRAMLWSGGIGDFIHYVAAFDACEVELRPRFDVLWIESSAPAALAGLIELLLPDVPHRFVPGRIHWTRAVPLLSATDPAQWSWRPAHRYVREAGDEVAIDWFLPTCCPKARSSARLSRLRQPSPVDVVDVIVSLRDKGALWWPSEPALRAIERLPGTVRGLGTRDELERFPGFLWLSPAGDVLQAAVLSANAKLYLGTDTGLATIREYTGGENIYCIDADWRRRWMEPFDYWPVRGGSERSTFCTSQADLERAIDRRIGEVP